MEWDPKYSVEIESIDRQHQSLFKIFSKLSKVQDEEFEFTKVVEILHELTSFATEHFDTEEAMMRDTSYPDYISHANKHLEFKEKILQFCQLAIEESSPDILKQLNLFLSNWMSTHLMKMDRAYMGHFKRHGIT